MKKHTVKRSMGILIAAALLILAMAGTAAAATTHLFGLLDYVNRDSNGPKPLERAKDLVQEQPESEWTCANGTVRVCEAIYAGKTYSILLRTSFESGFPELRLLNAEQDVSDLRCSQAGGGFDFILGGTVLGDAPETLKAEIEVPLSKDGEILEPLVIPLELTLGEGESAKLRPVNGCEDWALIDATLTNNPFIASLEVIFQSEQAKEYDMGVDILLLDSQGNRVDSGSGLFMEEVILEDGSIAYRDSKELQSFDHLPQKVFLQPKVIGEDRWLEKIECEVVWE